MRPCRKNRYATEDHARAAFDCHPRRKNEPYVIVHHTKCGGWHIVPRSEERRFTGFRFNTPASPAPTAPSRWRSRWYNAGAYAAGDAVEHDGRAWLVVVNYTMDPPGASDSWREVTTCMGEPLCAPALCGPPCHHPACPVRSLPAHHLPHA
ncbi:hypothetical protein EJ357_44665 [Streptomyces cyaneochromogenes]|uniref:Uncharacterized protein n=1 Tax=Streptomyces cyaneochromogenes TaxID=2496836 RepID=A0A3Q9F0R7_9ACTN|nr:hypothetical protein [Streptomyces cyaneochromogenes]AZQ39657.1 hypothetical protein EJ357_44665 [Streptomyces cyaneochromogenes]